jgi:hypothetical protein
MFLIHFASADGATGWHEYLDGVPRHGDLYLYNGKDYVVLGVAWRGGVPTATVRRARADETFRFEHLERPPARRQVRVLQDMITSLRTRGMTIRSAGPLDWVTVRLWVSGLSDAVCRDILTDLIAILSRTSFEEADDVPSDPA